MKRALLLFSVILSIMNSADAQLLSVLSSANANWSFRSCGVTDINNCTSEEFECLWEKATKNVRVGSIISGIGFVGIGSTVLLTTLSLGAEIDISDPFWAGLVYLSIGTAIIGSILGLPIWITGASRKSNLRKNPHYEALNISSLNIYPSLYRNHFNNSYSLGVTATLSF